MDATREEELVRAPLIVPSQQRLARCTRCGCPTWPGHLCQSCANVTMASSSKLYPTAQCAACHTPFSVPSRYHTTHTLCPLCQTRRPRPELARANPYPVIHPHGLPIPSTTTNPLRVCMRFGCGGRLPEHVRGDVCAACAGAGFAGRLPAKRVPRRRADRMADRPRESLEAVRASLARKEAVIGTRVESSEDLELDLVYPDDTTVSEGHTTVESKEEDAVLELVYPQDAAKHAQRSLPKPQPALNPPTTLRELFATSLRTTPLQHVLALAEKSPPRHCRMPDCNEVLPPQTSMERCVKCSIDDWKRRKLAAKDASESMQHLGTTGSELTGTSVEEQEVATMLHQASEVEDGNDGPPPSSSLSGTGLLGDHDSSPLPGWDSDLTGLTSDSESDNVSGSDSGSESESVQWPLGDFTGLTIRIPLLVHRLPPDLLLRKCGIKRCNIALPKDYRWKTCDPCRRAQQRYQERRLENQRRSILGMDMLPPSDMPCRRWRSLSPEMYKTDTNLTPETSRPCSSKGCPTRIPLPGTYRWKTCTRCRAKARRKARRKRDALAETRRASCPPEVVPRFRAYQNRDELLSSLHAQLKGFVEGQIMYLRTKLQENEAWHQGESPSRELGRVPMMFVFVGEYSVLTGQRDGGEVEKGGDTGEMEPMRREVSGVVAELERALRTTFSPGEASAIDQGGMIVRFTCTLELITQLRPLGAVVGDAPAHSDPGADRGEGEDGDGDVSPGLKLTPPPPAVPLVKTFAGELEAVVVPDESHHLFHGRRTVIRFCIFG